MVNPNLGGQFRRTGHGQYENGRWTVQHAYSASPRSGNPVRSGWHLLDQGEWSNTFPTKSEAIDASRRVEERGH